MLKIIADMYMYTTRNTIRIFFLPNNEHNLFKLLLQCNQTSTHQLLNFFVNLQTAEIGMSCREHFMSSKSISCHPVCVVEKAQTVMNKESRVTFSVSLSSLSIFTVNRYRKAIARNDSL